MNIYAYLVNLYNQFLLLFPVPLRWAVTLMVIVGLVIAFFNLIRYHWLFLIVLIVFLPVLFPILRGFFGDLYAFFLYLVNILQSTAPQT